MDRKSIPTKIVSFLLTYSDSAHRLSVIPGETDLYRAHFPMHTLKRNLEDARSSKQANGVLPHHELRRIWSAKS